mgnify:CR=1 FL=1
MLKNGLEICNCKKKDCERFGNHRASFKAVETDIILFLSHTAYLLRILCFYYTKNLIQSRMYEIEYVYSCR